MGKDSEMDIKAIVDLVSKYVPNDKLGEVQNLVKSSLGQDGKFELTDIPAFAKNFEHLIDPKQLKELEQQLAKFVGDGKLDLGGLTGLLGKK